MKEAITERNGRYALIARCSALTQKAYAVNSIRDCSDAFKLCGPYGKDEVLGKECVRHKLPLFLKCADTPSAE